MRKTTLASLDELLLQRPILRGGSVEEHEIAAAEQALGLDFDKDYREFLRCHGGAMIGSFPVFGLRQAEVMESGDSVVSVTERCRKQGWLGTLGTDEWVVISCDLGGSPIGLTREGEVWISDHDFGGVRRLHATFEDFVVALLVASRE